VDEQGLQHQKNECCDVVTRNKIIEMRKIGGSKDVVSRRKYLQS